MIVETKKHPCVKLYKRPTTEILLSDDRIQKCSLQEPLKKLIRETIQKYYRNVGAVEVASLQVRLLVEDTAFRRQKESHRIWNWKETGSK